MSKRDSNAATGTMLGPSDGALSGSSCVSMNTAAQPTATAARASIGTKRRSPPLLVPLPPGCWTEWVRSEEHTSELQSLMRISYAVFCLKKKQKTNKHHQQHNTTINTKQIS